MNVNNLAAAQKALPGRLAKASQNAAASLARLASGLRLQRAGDDVASLSIATRMQSSVRGLRSASLNVAQATSLLQVADGGLAQLEGLAQRMKSLSVMSQSGAISSKDRAHLNLEFLQLKEEMARIAEQTSFNGVKLLNGAKEPAPPTPVDQTITGTVSPEFLEGNNGNDRISPLDGNDQVFAGSGDDTVMAGVSMLAGLQGSLYDSAAPVSNLAAANAIILAQTPTALFHSSALDYQQGPTGSSNGTVGAFLGTDGASLTLPSLLTTSFNTVVMRFTGNIDVASTGTYSFTTSSDDGFSLTIGGTTFSQFPGLRGFSPTTDSITLSAGKHSFELVYFDNAAQEGLELRSSLTAGGIVGSTVLSTPSSPSDGNDTLDGGAGIDTVIYTGNKADYVITALGHNEFSITDTRSLSPDGMDRVKNIEQLRFNDGTIELKPDEIPPEPEPGILRFPISETAGQEILYRIVDATPGGLFAEPEALTIDPFEKAVEAFAALGTAIERITSHRSYVGSTSAQADLIFDAISSRMFSLNKAQSELVDTDIAKTSTDYNLQLVKADIGVLVAAQTNTLQSDAVLRLMPGGAAN